MFFPLHVSNSASSGSTKIKPVHMEAGRPPSPFNTSIVMSVQIPDSPNNLNLSVTDSSCCKQRPTENVWLWL